MLWLSRPPILRPLLAVVALASGLAIELMPADTVDHPFAVHDLPAGTVIDLVVGDPADPAVVASCP